MKTSCSIIQGTRAKKPKIKHLADFINTKYQFHLTRCFRSPSHEQNKILFMLEAQFGRKAKRENTKSSNKKTKTPF